MYMKFSISQQSTYLFFSLDRIYIALLFASRIIDTAQSKLLESNFWTNMRIAVSFKLSVRSKVESALQQSRHTDLLL